MQKQSIKVMYNLPEAVTIFENESDKEKKLVFENEKY